MPRHTYFGTKPLTPFEHLPASVREMSYYDLSKLQGSEFHDVHAQESHGGNAGFHTTDGKRWIVSAVNGYASKESGRFAAFGNFQFLDPALVQSPDYEEIGVQLGSRYYRDTEGWHYERRIVDLMSYTGESDIKPYAVDAMLGAVMLYNEQQYLHDQ